MSHFPEETARIREILRGSPQGMSITEIARAIGRNNHSVGRYLDNLLVSGHVEMRTYGKAKVFTLSTRVPLNTMLWSWRRSHHVLDKDIRVVRVNAQVLAFSKTTDSFIGKYPGIRELPTAGLIRSSRRSQRGSSPIIPIAR
jgi:hypothetical protein